VNSPPATRIRSGGVPPLLDILAALLVTGLFWVPPAFAVANLWSLMTGCLLATVAAAAMVARQPFPLAATGAAGLATTVGSALGVCRDPMLATAWCLYSLAVTKSPRTRHVGVLLVASFAGFAAVTALPTGAGAGLARRFVLAVMALCVAWLLGTAVGREVISARTAERARVQLELARDVHDVVGHALGAITAEAGVTRGLVDAGEQELRDSLAGIETHARQALQEVQHLVRGLRTQPALDADGSKPLVARLHTLIDTTRAGGIGVDARIPVGEGLDDSVGLVVVRVVQESLANVMRHSAGAPCSVDVSRAGDAVVVRVRDHGPGLRAGITGAEPSGSGLPGLRDRARSVGGTAAWGDHPDGGFEVSVRLPVSGGAR